MLGICRGMQLLNVACGGTLVQHLPERTGDQHRPMIGAFSEHPVRLEPGSLAARAVGAERTNVKSHHHQALDELGEGLAATGWAEPDELVEAIELPDRRHVLGVLWHPEEDERSRVIGALVDAPPAHEGEGGVITVVEPATGAGHGGGAAGAASRRPTPPWRARSRRSRAGAPSSPPDRSRLLRRLADALEGELDSLATLEARNAGKPISDARGEMAMVVETFRYYAAAPERLLGQTIPVAGGVDMTFREPLGVVGLITPWNFPLTIASWKVAPALAAGNTVVLKPAELTPLTALELERIALEAGLPEGVVNVVAGPGSVCGQRLVEHPDVAKVAFTGSTEVGRRIAGAPRPRSSA